MALPTISKKGGSITYNSTEILNTNDWNIVEIDSNYDVTKDDYTILVDCTNGDVIVYLPDLSLVQKKVFIIKKIDDSENIVIIKCKSVSQTIDGSEEIYIMTENNSFGIQTGVTSYYIIF